MIKKICSILLVICLIVCLVPEAVFGASKITRKDGSALDKVYVGSKYTLVVKDKQVKFSSANSKIATFTKTGKLKPLAAGKVKITAKNVDSGKAVASKVVTVLKRSEKVKADTKEIYLNKGETQKIKATLEPADSSDYIYFKSSNKEVAEVDSETGEITAIKNGEATITLYAKATKATKNSSENNRTTTVKVYVGPIMKEAKQLSVTVVELNFMTNMENYRLKPSDFTIKCTETSGIFPVRAVSVSGKTVKLTTYGEIKDGKVYRVSYDTTSANFTATEAKVKSMRIEPTVIDVKTLTEIKLVLLDKDGVIVGSYNQNNKPPNVDFNIDTTDGFVSGGKLYLNTVNSKAIAKAVYHTYIYKKDEKTGNMVEAGVLSTGDVTISAVEPKEDEKKEETTTPSYVPSISPYDVKYAIGEELLIEVKSDDSNERANDEINAYDLEAGPEPVVDLMVAPDFNDPIKSIYFDKNDERPTPPAKIYFNIKKYGEEVKDYSSYIVMLVGDAEVATIEGSETSENKKNCKMQKEGYITLTPTKAGNATLVIRDGSNLAKTIVIPISSAARVPTKILPVTYNAEGTAQIANQIEVENYPTYSDGETENKDNMQANIEFLLKDQYGNILYKDTDYTDVALTNVETYISQNKFDEINLASVNFNGEGLEPGEKKCKLLLKFTYPEGKYKGSNNFWGRTITMKVNPPEATLEAKPNYSHSEEGNIKDKNFIANAYILRLNGKAISLLDASQETGGNTIPYYIINYVNWKDGDNKPSTIEYKIRYGKNVESVLTKTFKGNEIPDLPQTEAGGGSTPENEEQTAA